MGGNVDTSTPRKWYQLTQCRAKCASASYSALHASPSAAFRARCAAWSEAVVSVPSAKWSVWVEKLGAGQSRLIRSTSRGSGHCINLVQRFAGRFALRACNMALTELTYVAVSFDARHVRKSLVCGDSSALRSMYGMYPAARSDV